MSQYSTALMQHYEGIWNCEGRVTICPPTGRIVQVNPDFELLEIAPGNSRVLWTYATVGMTGEVGDASLELHTFSSAQNVTWLRILESVAYFHLTAARLGLGHTVNFGVELSPGSSLTHGLISLPYLDGPALENFSFQDRSIRCLWLIPVTKSEVEYRKKHGLEALEEIFQKATLDFANPFRESVIQDSTSAQEQKSHREK